MTKRGAIVKFCVIGVLVALGVVLTFVSFNIPFFNNGTTTFRGSMGAIESKMGIDLRGGHLIIFNASPNPEQVTTMTQSQMLSATEERLRQTLIRHNFPEATVRAQGTDQIRVEVPGVDEGVDLLNILGRPAVLEMRPANDNTPFIRGRDITGVSIRQQPDGSWGVLINFTSTGGAAFRTAGNAANASGESIRIFMSDEYWTSIAFPEPPPANRDEAFIVGGGQNGWNRTQAQDFQTRIESGMFLMLLDVHTTDRIPPTLGQGALTAGIIAFAIGFAFIALVLFLRYGHLGLLGILSMIIFAVIFLFTLASVEMVQLTLPGIAGIVLAMAMAVDAMIIIFERIRDEYKLGKKMTVAVESGFKKSFWTIFDANITTILAGIVLYFLGTGPIQGFAIVLLLGVAVSMFTSLFVLRQLAKLYLVINPSNSKHLKMKQDRTLFDIDEYKQSAPKKEKRKLNV